jgi:hypothetical protein
MANYGGPYTNDLGKAHPLVALGVYAVVDGTRSNTPASFDSPYLPASWQAATTLNGFGCAIPETLRIARAWYAANAYLAIPVPWPGGTPEFNQFWAELVALSGVLMATLEGERMDCFWLDTYANQP